MSNLPMTPDTPDNSPNPFVGVEVTNSKPRLIEILNLGAGVQSSTVLLMSLSGELPKLDHAIFADTGWEPAAVYRQMDWLEGLATAAGVKVHRVSIGNIRDDALNVQRNYGSANGVKQHFGSMPLFTLSPEGNRGMFAGNARANTKSIRSSSVHGVKYWD